MRIVNLTRNTILAEKVVVANSSLSRMKGLLGRAALEENEALIIRPCNSVHTFFMRFAIDVIFLDRQNKVVGLKENMLPFRLSRIYLTAHQTIELPAHKTSSTLTRPGDLIQIEE